MEGSGIPLKVLFLQVVYAFEYLSEKGPDMEIRKNPKRAWLLSDQKNSITVKYKFCESGDLCLTAKT